MFELTNKSNTVNNIFLKNEEGLSIVTEDIVQFFNDFFFINSPKQVASRYPDNVMMLMSEAFLCF